MGWRFQRRVQIFPGLRLLVGSMLRDPHVCVVMLPFMNLRSIEPAGLLPHQRPANGNPYLEHPNEEDAKFEIGHASQAAPKRAYILHHFLSVLRECVSSLTLLPCRLLGIPSAH